MGIIGKIEKGRQSDEAYLRPTLCLLVLRTATVTTT